MQITLLRAARLQAAIHETLKGLKISPRAEFSIFADFDTEVEAEKNKLVAAIEKHSKLTAALFEVRRLTARANIEAGVSGLLADQAENDMRIELLSALAAVKPFEGADISRKRADRLATQPHQASPYGRDVGPKETLDIGLLDAEAIEAYGVELLEAKKVKVDLKDRLTEKNAGTTITLGPETAGLLKAEHLL
ncbi:hypothetical protein ACEUZ9_000993 [Paracoccus litorisediminis]|uniref:hypothetical protein n=1 Tax=Paracoccus litorisediminis TaxID=2006130 RepID=UPI00372FF88A